MPDFQHIKYAAAEGIASLTLNRPERHNALDETTIRELSEALQRAGDDAAVRVVQIEANGKSFCAGADLDWMKRTAGYSQAENEADARRLADMIARLARLPKPTVALIQGPAYGGGVGIVAACDIAVAADTAGFVLSEVRLGLIPAVISPHVIRAIGVRAMQYYTLTADRFDAREAYRLGLVQMVVPAEELSAAGARVVAALLAGGPRAQADSKRLVADVAGRPFDDALLETTARRIAESRATPEAQAGIAAFFARRPPPWSKG